MGFSSSGGAKVGTIEMWGGNTAPDGYLICDGGAISRTVYKDLFDAIGTTYGAGDGTTTFNLPNFANAKLVSSENVGIKGTGKCLGITDGSTNYGFRYQNGFMTAGLLNKGVGTSNSTTSVSFNNKGLGIVTNTSNSGITGVLNVANSCNFIIKY